MHKLEQPLKTVHESGPLKLELLLTPLNRLDVSLETCQLADAIRTGVLAPGAALPAERVLCQEFGVARTSVREAIQGLMIAGYVERRGNRSVVAERLPQVSFDGSDRKSAITQLFEVRRIIEPQIAELAARRATEADRRELVDLAARTPHDLAEFRRTDRRFHALLARCCGNPMLTEVHTKVQASMFVSCGLAALLYEELEPSQAGTIIDRSTADHRAIAAAVAKGQARKAATAVVTHLDDLERQVVARLEVSI